MEKLLQTADDIGMEALMLVTSRYGSGYEVPVPEVKALPYHNMHHTTHVREDSRLLAALIGLDGLSQATVRMAASAHDVVHQKPRGVMERESAEWLGVKMHEAGFPGWHIKAGILAVLGTEPLFAESGPFVGQVVSTQAYDDEKQAEIAAIVASADMAKLYAPEGPLLARNLYLETAGLAEGQEAELTNWLKFQKHSLDLMHTYRFPHPGGEQLFGGLRREVTEYQIGVTQDVWLGNIATWQELLESDVEFAERWM